MELKKFKKIYIEITNRCNLSCSFCHRSRRPAGFMDRVEFETLLERIRGYTDHLSLHVLGEPLLHPELGLLLDSCHQHGFKVNLSTNGVLIPQHRDMLLSKPALRQINFSLHSFEQPETGLPLAFYLASIFEFIGKAVAETSMVICLRIWNLDAAATGAEVTRTREILKRIQSFFGLPFEISEEVTPGNGISLAPACFSAATIDSRGPIFPDRSLAAGDPAGGFGTILPFSWTARLCPAVWMPRPIFRLVIFISCRLPKFFRVCALSLFGRGF